MENHARQETRESRHNSGVKNLCTDKEEKKNDKKYENIIELWHENIIYSESPAHP